MIGYVTTTAFVWANSAVTAGLVCVVLATPSRVVLTAARAHDKRPEAASLLNLAALCQRCHLAHNAKDSRASWGLPPVSNTRGRQCAFPFIVSQIDSGLVVGPSGRYFPRAPPLAHACT